MTDTSTAYFLNQLSYLWTLSARTLQPNKGKSIPRYQIDRPTDRRTIPSSQPAAQQFPTIDNWQAKLDLDLDWGFVKANARACIDKLFL